MKSDFFAAYGLKFCEKSVLYLYKMAKNLRLLNGRCHDGDRSDHDFGNHVDYCSSSPTSKAADVKPFGNNLNLSSSRAANELPDFSDKFAGGDNKFVMMKGKTELQHLKELLLLNLDVIQQQQEELRTKDRRIKTVLQEKETLKCRLNRMERRLSLLKQKEVKQEKVDNEGSSSHHLAIRQEPGVEREVKDQATATVQVKQESVAESTQPPVSQPLLDYFDWTALPVSKEKLTARDQTLESEVKDQATATVHVNIETVETGTQTESWRACTALPKGRRGRKRKQQGIVSRAAKRLAFSESITGKKVTVPSQSNLEEKSAVSGTYLQTEPCLQLNDERFLKCSRYYSCSVDTLFATSDESKVSHQRLVEVPTWRFHPLTSCYSLEGTEDLDDEVFLKRHQKLEMDEKRRKRWDIQRLREQKLLEKLDKKSKEKEKEKETEISTFYPPVDDTQVIEVSDTVPVVAFGSLIPNFQSSNFTLPWFHASKKGKKSTQKRKSGLKSG